MFRRQSLKQDKIKHFLFGTAGYLLPCAFPSKWVPLNMCQTATLNQEHGARSVWWMVWGSPVNAFALGGGYSHWSMPDKSPRTVKIFYMQNILGVRLKLFLWRPIRLFPKILASPNDESKALAEQENISQASCVRMGGGLGVNKEI